MSIQSGQAPETIDSILRFWFGDELTGQMGQAQSRRWFQGGEKLDATLKERFEDSIKSAANKQNEHWRESAEGCLALILLFDQFPRNIWRAQAQAFAYTEQAMSICNQGIELGFPEQLDIFQRVFFYLPLEHHESIESQKRALQLYEALLDEAPQKHKAFARGTLEFAQKHANIIETFGRYPYRNEVLGRQNTPAEIAWLENTSNRFGQ